jgi:hypothetical protein
MVSCGFSLKPIQKETPEKFTVHCGLKKGT